MTFFILLINFYLIIKNLRQKITKNLFFFGLEHTTEIAFLFRDHDRPRSFDRRPRP